MAKKKISRQAQKSKFPFAHPTRHGKMHWKKVLFIVLIGSFGLIILSAVTAQTLYNRYIWDRLNENSSIKISLLIQNALDGLENLKQSPVATYDGRLRVAEARLVLPPENENVRKLMYLYSRAESGSDGAGYTWDFPESVSITTKQIADLSKHKIMIGRNVEETFNFVPEAQACSRGYKMQFTADTENAYNLVGQKQLADGRTLFVYREPDCKSYSDLTDKLEFYLLQADSY